LTLCDRIVYRGYIPRQKQADKLEINCVILAGGKSVRFGHDKISEKIGTTSLLEKVISRVVPLSKKLIIVTSKERSFGQLAKNPNINVVSDILPGQGSLGGIYTGLVKSDSFYNLVVAADMPFLNEPLLQYMIKVTDGYDFTLPHIKDWYEPLHAIYSKNCLEPIKSILEGGNKVIVELFNYVKVRFVEAEEVDRFDPKHLSFFNINTKEDMERAIMISGGTGD
jgi:molybdopterin-guanine dinucleotide biosynthesis protein A